MNKLLERAETARGILDSLTEEDREALSPYVEEIKSVQREFDAFLEELDVADRCAKCLTSCCTVGIEQIITEEYLFFLLFRLSDETRYDIWHVLNKENDTEDCRFLGKTGCIIPADSRPFICKNFLCGKFGPVQKLGQIFSGKMETADARFKTKLSSLGFWF